MSPDPNRPSVDALLAETTWIASLARSLVVDPGTADDVAQDAAVAAFERAPADLTSPRGWLRRVVGRLASNARRSASRRAVREATVARDDAAEATDEIVARWEIRRRVVEAVLALEEPYRATILARYFDGLPVLEAAARFGVPPETVRTRTRRGLDLLRGRLADLDDGRGQRGVAVVVWLVGPAAEAPFRLGRGAGAASAGGLVMAAATKWTLATAAVLLLGFGVVWTLRSGETPPPEVAVGGDATSESAATGRPRAARTPADDLGAEVGSTTAGGDAPVDLDACDRERDLHGVVVDADGRPVAGAVVTALRNDAWRLRIPDIDSMFRVDAVQSTRTAADGTFALRLGAADGVGLRAESDGYATWESLERQAGERVRIVLGPAVTLTGKVRREDGAPVAGASVRVLGSPRDELMVRARGTTDAAGAVSFRGVPRGTRLSILVEPTGVGSAVQTSKKLDDLPEQTFEVVVPTGRDLTGRLVDAATEAPVSGGSVGTQKIHLAAVAAAEDGTFTHRGFGGPDSTLSAKAPGYAHTIVRVPNDATEVRVPMMRGVAATGCVVDAAGGPIGGAVVSLFASFRDETDSRLSYGTATAASDGTFRVAGLFGGTPHLLTVRAAGFATLRREVPLAGAPGAEVPLDDVVLGPGRFVRVVALGPDDVPVPRQEVHLVFGEFSMVDGIGNAEVRRTDDLGRASFPDAPRGSYVARAGRDGPEVRVEVGNDDPAPVVLRVGAPPGTPAAAIAAAGELVVSVVDEDGAPIAGASVYVNFERGGARFLPCGATGAARFPCPSAPIRAVASVPSPHCTDPLGVEIAPGQREARIVAVRGAPIAGRVLDSDGNPVAGANVSIHGPRGAMYATYSAGPTGADGAFAVHVRPGDPVDLEVVHRLPSSPARGPFPTAWRRGVPPGGEGVDLRLSLPGATNSFRVRVLDPDGAPLGGVAILVLPLGAGRWVRATTGDDGTAVVADVALVPCSVVTSPRESSPAIQAFAAPRAARVVPGEDEEVVLRALPAVHVRGRVVVPEGASPARLSVTAGGAEGYTGVALTEEDGSFDLLLPAGGNARWDVGCSVTFPSKGRTGSAMGVVVVRAPADGVEIRCEPMQ